MAEHRRTPQPRQPLSGDGPVECCVQPGARMGARADPAAVQPTPAWTVSSPCSPRPTYSLRIPGGSPALCSEQGQPSAVKGQGVLGRKRADAADVMVRLRIRLFLSESALPLHMPLTD